MRVAVIAVLLCTGCISSPDAGGSGGGGSDASTSGETSTTGNEESGTGPTDAGSTADDGSADAGDGACLFWVDDAGVTHGCDKGSQGPGDRDDGGGAPAPPPPDVSEDAGDLGLGSPCWDNAQCVSLICFDYAARGTFCTQRCFTNADCPPPANGCNGMGVCRFGDGG